MNRIIDFDVTVDTADIGSGRRTTGWEPGVSFSSNFVRQKAISFIDRNLFSQQLRPATIAEGVHVSRAVLYRAFQADGGVASFLHERRLDKARLMLRERAGEPGIVSKVAAAHGYSSAVRFSRLFASRFAEQPAQFVRRIRRPELGAGEAGDGRLDAVGVHAAAR